MSKFSRRTLVQISALPLAAQTHQHDAAAPSAAPSVMARTKFFTDHEFATLKTLCDCILPADDVSAAASAAGAPEYIELLASNNPKLAHTFRGGLAWLNAQSRGQMFTADQTGLLDRICDRRRAAPADKPGAEFFDWARKLTIDAFYTHPAGYKDVDYRGGKGMTEFTIPKEALDQALDKANLK